MSIIFPSQEKYCAILLFGPPGSGKGTMGQFLAGGGKHFHLSSGDIFRGLSPDSPGGKIARQYMNQGLLLPDEQAIEIWKYYVDGLVATNRYFPRQQYLLLDGMPRTLKQAETLGKYVVIHRVISLEMPDQEALFKRLRLRAKAEGRVDDMKDEVLVTRMQVYKKETEEMLSYYPNTPVHRINAQQGMYEVLYEILNHLAPVLSTPPT